jgi:hypothetical protein
MSITTRDLRKKIQALQAQLESFEDDLREYRNYHEPPHGFGRVVGCTEQLNAAASVLSYMLRGDEDEK